jgi:hypothetical protein
MIPHALHLLCIKVKSTVHFLFLASQQILKSVRQGTLKVGQDVEEAVTFHSCSSELTDTTKQHFDAEQLESPQSFWSFLATSLGVLSFCVQKHRMRHFTDHMHSKTPVPWCSLESDLLWRQRAQGKVSVYISPSSKRILSRKRFNEAKKKPK